MIFANLDRWGRHLVLCLCFKSEVELRLMLLSLHHRLCKHINFFQQFFNLAEPSFSDADIMRSPKILEVILTVVLLYALQRLVGPRIVDESV